MKTIVINLLGGPDECDTSEWIRCAICGEFKDEDVKTFPICFECLDDNLGPEDK